ncbi:HAD-IA family hydrolase [Glycomyces buryatensis]|uniref:HAD family hydrolase n=1 Tax=Glycomyces buryatensis TaxID=2570927 RepID=A0A4S8QGE5_9ACTN|nr:HAD-IA family hydrolase [Glycomyces buryatensis]THV42242.1 HAD family hydrolase [Glycomyces buryatensis]
MSDETLSAEVVLFDMDGTLVDSTKVVERTWRRFAERHGLDAESILAVSHGRPTAATVARFATQGMHVAAETAVLQAEELDDVDGIVEVPGARALLETLDPERWAVVTSADRELTKRRMGAAGLPMPRILVSADDVTVGKPDPQGYRSAAQILGVDPASAVVFEDAEAGLMAARASGAAPIVVGDYAGPAAEGLTRIPDLRPVRIQREGRGLSVRLIDKL